MELSIFMKQLETALINRGISPEVARKHVTNIRRTFTSEDLSEINSMNTDNEIEALADSIAAILGKSPAKPEPESDPAASSDETGEEPPVQQRRPAPYRSPIATEQKPIQRADDDDIPEMNDDYFTYVNESEPTTKGLTIFWVGLFATLPITIPLLAAIFGTFALLFVGLALISVLSIAAMIGIVAAGSIVSLVGIIYGVTQLFSFPAAGVYEIGLGTMLAGIVLFTSVLLYNLAIRFIPWLIKKVAALLVYVCGKLKLLFYFVRRECYKL